MSKPIHIEQLDISHHFTQSEVKHMLPYYQSNTISNLFTVMQFFISHGYPHKHTVFCLDQTLTNQLSQHPLYTHVQTIYCEDSDKEQNRLLTTLNLATMFINYIYSFGGQSQGSEFSRTVSHAYQDYIKKTQIVSLDKSQIYNKKSQYGTHTDRIDAVALISYNFIQKDTDIFINLGFSECREDSIGILLATVRNWNLGRLGISHRMLDRYSLERLQKITRSLFIQGRTFLRRNQEVSDDYNSYSGNLRKLIHRLAEWANEHPDAIEPELQQYIKQSMQFFRFNQLTALPHTLKLIRVQIVTKGQLSQGSLCKIMVESVTEWLMQAPLNVSCSYASFLHKQPQSSKTTMWLSLYYITESVSTLQQKFITEQDSLQFCHKIQRLLIDQKTQRLNSSTPIQSNISKSFAMLSKYNGKQFQMKINDPSMPNLTQFAPITSQVDLNQSFVSYASNSMQMQKKINMKRVAKIQNSIYEILRELESSQPILSPSQLEKKIQVHCQFLQRQYSSWKMTDNLNAQQYLMFESLWTVVEELTSDNINSLMKQNPNELNCLLNMLMQVHNYDKMISLGKILGQQNLQNLFRSCLEKGLRKQRDCIIIVFLKKMIENYRIAPSQDLWKPLILQSISIPELLQLLETKQYDESPSYAALIKCILPQLFHTDRNLHPLLNSTTMTHIRIISPLLYLYNEHLLRQNHPHELVYSFIGEMLFEAVYYWKQGVTSLVLTNSPYIHNSHESSQMSLKQKKVMQILREGGFQGHGYEVKMRTYPLISSNRNHSIQAHSYVYDVMRIPKPLDALKFFRLLSNSHINEKVIRFGRFYKQHQFFEEELKQSKALICFLLRKRAVPQVFPDKSQTQIINEDEQRKQFESISRRILTSESGIFEDMARLNPALKIGGVEIKSAIRELAATRKQLEEENSKKRGVIEVQKAKEAFVTDQVRFNYEMVQLASNLKAKYVDYHLLSEDEKLYFRECAQNVIGGRGKIREYIQLNSQINQLCSDAT